MAPYGSGLNRWGIVGGSALGLTVGNGPIMQFTFGVFLKPVAADFGTDRGTLSIAILIGLSLTGVATPVVGALVDRYGIRRVALPCIALFALTLAALGWLATSVASVVLIYGIMGVFAALLTPLPYAKSLAAAFDRNRGLALGIAMAGVGLGTVVMPQVAQAVITRFGWRPAFVVLAVILFLIATPCMAFLVRDPNRTTQGGRQGTEAPAILEGWTGGHTLGSSTFWIVAFAFFVLALSCSGIIAHIAAVLTDQGVAPQAAAAALGIAGLSLITGRVVAGYMLDRIFAPYVAAFFFVLPVVGIGLLLAGSPSLAFAGTVLIGLGLGAEIDMIAFLISRYFGMKAFGQIYGYLFAVFMLANGLGPFIMGVTFTRSGSYAVALIGMAVGLVVSTGLILRLGPYNFAGHGAGTEGRMTAPGIRTASP